MSEWIVYSKDGQTERCKVKKLEYNGEFLGACTVSISISSPTAIDFQIGDYIVYRGERFEMNYDPTIVKQSAAYTDGEGFVYDNVVFNSLSDELTRCDFLDYVPSDNEIHYSSLPNFSFFADSIDKLAERIKVNLDRIYTGEKEWTVEVHHEYVNTKNVNIQVNNNTVWDALGFVNSKFGANFIIRNRTITIGTTGVAIGNLFSYGKGNGLYKIERNAESDQKIITRLRVYGSTRNMSSTYYHNISGGNLPNNMAVRNLMLPDFPLVTHDPYIDSANIEELGIREGTVFFDGSGDLEEIYPTMEGMTAEDLADAGIIVDATGELDIVKDAEQITDNGKFQEGDNISPFTITLKDIGFDINDYLSTSSATISMKDGMCGGREFEIVKCEKFGSDYILTCNRSYDESLDLYFPYYSYQIKGGDKYVLLNIEMSDVYIKAASQRLLKAGETYLAKNDYVRYSYIPSVDNIYMARQHDEAVKTGTTSIHDTIKEGDLMLFEDSDLGVNGSIIVSSLTIKENLEDSLIPEYEITLKNEKTVGTLEKIQNQISSIISGGVGSGNSFTTEQIESFIEAFGSQMFLRKDRNDRTPYNLGVGSLNLKDKRIDSFIRQTDEIPSDDESFYSSSMTDKRIEDEIKTLEDKYIRKDQDDSTEYSLGIGGELNVGKNADIEGNTTVGGSLDVSGDVSFKKNIRFQEKPITGFVRYYDEEKPEHSTDVDFYSALMTDKKIEEKFGGLDDKYLRKDKEDTAHKHITFEEGVTVYELAKMMNLEVEELATIAKAIVNTLSSSTFVDGFSGEGYQIWKDIATGDWSLTIDRVTVRKMMVIYELIVQKIRSAGGMIVVSAGNGKVKSVERVGNEYKFTFEDVNTFQINDLMRCQVFSPVGLKSYWVEITKSMGDSVYAKVADFNGVVPESGDECVLMGNTKNELRQNLILISATEDGKPRFDCLDGVRTKSFEGCLKVRVGCLDGIQDGRFPAELQPQGYGLYGNNCYLTGVFVLSNGNDVLTQFSIMEGMIRSEISSVRAEINAQDNYLTNASFSSNLESWTYENDVRVFNTYGGLLHFNGDFYSIKNNFAGVVAKDSKNVLRIKNSFITQKNADYNIHPSFDLYEDVQTDAEGNETVTSYYRPRMFYVSFKYMCTQQGKMTVLFKNEKNDGSFEAYTPIKVEKEILPNVTFTAEEYEGKWNGTGDFYLSFTGDIYIYDLALSDNKLADVEEKFTMRFEATDKKIQANLDKIIKNDEKVEKYYGELKLTAETLESTFNKKISDQYDQITEEYSGKITQTAESLTSEYRKYVNDTKDDITEDYTSKIEQTAEGLTATFTKDIEDMANGLVSDYDAKIEATAESLTSDYSAVIQDLKDGTIRNMQSSIAQNASQISLMATKSELNDLEGRVEEAEASIELNASQIELRVTKTTFNALEKRVSSAETRITQTENQIELKASQESLDELGNIVSQNKASITVQANQITGLIEETNELGTKYSEVKQTVDGLTTTVKNLEGDVANLEIAADTISSTVSNLEGDVSSLEQTASGITTKVSNLEGDVSSLEQTATSISATVSNLEGDVSRVEQTAEGLQASVTDLDGNYASLSLRVGALESIVGDGAEGDFEGFQNALKDLLDKVTANTKAAASAQSTADEALGNTESNLTLINQNAKNISALAGKITTDADGNITNISTSGLVLDSEFASLFSTQVNSQGIAKTAQLSAYVLENELGELVSKLELSADQIDLTGKVTFADLSTGAKNSIKSYSTDAVSELEEALGVAAMADKTIISGGYIKTSLINANALSIKGSQVTGLTPAMLGLSDWVTLDSVEEAMENETLIVGGYIKTSMIDVDSLVVKKLQATSSGYTYSLDANGFNIKNSDSVSLCSMYVSNSVGLLRMDNASGSLGTLIKPGSVLVEGSGIQTSLYQGGVGLYGGAVITGFGVGNISSIVSSDVDFLKVSGSSTLPAASAWRGKVIFVKKTGGTLTVNNVYTSSGTSSTSSKSNFENGSRFFISDGTYWHEFKCF